MFWCSAQHFAVLHALMAAASDDPRLLEGVLLPLLAARARVTASEEKRLLYAAMDLPAGKSIARRAAITARQKKRDRDGEEPPATRSRTKQCEQKRLKVAAAAHAAFRRAHTVAELALARPSSLAGRAVATPPPLVMPNAMLAVLPPVSADDGADLAELRQLLLSGLSSDESDDEEEQQGPPQHRVLAEQFLDDDEEAQAQFETTYKGKGKGKASSRVPVVAQV